MSAKVVEAEKTKKSSSDGIFKVTIGDKTKKNPLYGTGSSKCYYLDGEEAPSLILRRIGSEVNHGEPDKYIFDVNTPGYPLILTLDALAGPSATRLTDPVENGKLMVTVDENFPSNLYYGSEKSEGMGGSISIADEVGFIEVKLGKVFKNPVKIRPYKGDFLVAGKTGRFGKYNESSGLTRIVDLESILESGITVYDFVVSDKCMWILCYREECMQVLEVFDFLDEFQVSEIRRFSGTENIGGYMELNSSSMEINVVIQKTLYILDGTKDSKRIDIRREKLNREPKCLGFHKELYAMDKDIFLGKVCTLNYEPKTCMFVTEKSKTRFFYGNSEGRISVLELDGDRLVENWQTNNSNLRGLFGLIQVESGKIYVALNSDNKLVVWELLGY